MFYLLALITAFTLTADVAFAQDTGIDIDLGPIRSLLTEFIGLLIMAFVGYISLWLRTKWKIDVDEGHRKSLQDALNNASNLLVGKVIPDGKTVRIEVGNASVANAIEYVIKSAPDALAHFGIDRKMIFEKLEPKILGMLNADPAAKGVSIEKAVDIVKK